MTCGRKKVLFCHTQYVEPSYMLYDGLALLQFKHSKQSITLYGLIYFRQRYFSNIIVMCPVVAGYIRLKEEHSTQLANDATSRW